MTTSSKILAVVTLASAISVQALPDHQGHPEAARFSHNLDDLAAVRSAHFMAMDLDGNGGVSREEITEYRAQQREQRTGSRADRFERADANGDGQVSAEEARAAAASRLAKLDKNGDGQLSHKEWRRHRGDGPRKPHMGEH